MPETPHQVQEIMTSPCVTAGPETPLVEVAGMMQSLDIGSVVIADPDDRLLGIISESDFTAIGRFIPYTLELAPAIFGERAATWEELRHIYDKAGRLKAREVMSRDVYTVKPTDPIGEVLRVMLARNMKHVPVVESGKAVGMVSRHDVLRLLLPNLGRG